MPFAFITTFSPIDDGRLFGEVQKLIREQQGSISALGGMIQGKNVIPKTRSGKMLRRNLRELVENAAEGKVDKEVKVPPVSCFYSITVEGRTNLLAVTPRLSR